MGHRQRFAEFRHGRSYGRFVLRVGKREQQRNGDGVRVGTSRTASRSRANSCFRRPLQDPALGIGPLLDAESQFPANQRRNPIKEKVIQARARLPSNLDDVFKSRRCNQRDAGAFPLQQSVGPDRGAVQQRKGSSSARLAIRPADFSQSFGNRARRIVGRRKYLQSFQSAALNPHAIGERASGVDCDAKRGMRCVCHEKGRLPLPAPCC